MIPEPPGSYSQVPSLHNSGMTDVTVVGANVQGPESSFEEGREPSSPLIRQSSSLPRRTDRVTGPESDSNGFIQNIEFPDFAAAIAGFICQRNIDIGMGDLSTRQECQSSEGGSRGGSPARQSPQRFPESNPNRQPRALNHHMGQINTQVSENGGELPSALCRDAQGGILSCSTWMKDFGLHLMRHSRTHVCEHVDVEIPWASPVPEPNFVYENLKNLLLRIKEERLVDQNNLSNLPSLRIFTGSALWNHWVSVKPLFHSLAEVQDNLGYKISFLSFALPYHAVQFFDKDDGDWDGVKKLVHLKEIEIGDNVPIGETPFFSLLRQGLIEDYLKLKEDIQLSSGELLPSKYLKERELKIRVRSYNNLCGIIPQLVNPQVPGAGAPGAPPGIPAIERGPGGPGGFAPPARGGNGRNPGARQGNVPNHPVVREPNFFENLQMIQTEAKVSIRELTLRGLSYREMETFGESLCADLVDLEVLDIHVGRHALRPNSLNEILGNWINAFNRRANNVRQDLRWKNYMEMMKVLKLRQIRERNLLIDDAEELERELAEARAFATEMEGDHIDIDSTGSLDVNWNPLESGLSLTSTMSAADSNTDGHYDPGRSGFLEGLAEMIAPVADMIATEEFIRRGRRSQDVVEDDVNRNSGGSGRQPESEPESEPRTDVSRISDEVGGNSGSNSDDVSSVISDPRRLMVRGSPLEVVIPPTPSLNPGGQSVVGERARSIVANVHQPDGITPGAGFMQSSASRNIESIFDEDQIVSPNRRSVEFDQDLSASPNRRSIEIRSNSLDLSRSDHRSIPSAKGTPSVLQSLPVESEESPSRNGHLLRRQVREPVDPENDSLLAAVRDSVPLPVLAPELRMHIGHSNNIKGDFFTTLTQFQDIRIRNNPNVVELESNLQATELPIIRITNLRIDSGVDADHRARCLLGGFTANVMKSFIFLKELIIDDYVAPPLSGLKDILRERTETFLQEKVNLMTEREVRSPKKRAISVSSAFSLNSSPARRSRTNSWTGESDDGEMGEAEFGGTGNFGASIGSQGSLQSVGLGNIPHTSSQAVKSSSNNGSLGLVSKLRLISSKIQSVLNQIYNSDRFIEADSNSHGSMLNQINYILKKETLPLLSDIQANSGGEWSWLFFSKTKFQH